MKIHYHADQFDGNLYSWCGKPGKVVLTDEFEATNPELRCKKCDRDWFPHGQPEWHLKQAQERFAKNET